MKLCNVPPNTTVRLLENARVAPGSLTIEKGDILKFRHIDGMYSSCVWRHDSIYPGDRLIVHPAATTEVEIVEDL